MNFPRIDSYFETEAQALEEIAARGWHGFVVDLDPEEDLHWHDFDAVVFVLEGKASAEFADGSIEEASVGSKVEAPAGIVPGACQFESGSRHHFCSNLLRFNQESRKTDSISIG